MALFKRRKEAARTGDPIGDFWSWWTAAGAAKVADAIARQQPESTTGLLSDHVGRLPAALDWELGPGLHAQHVLVVTAAGDPAARAVARRWLRSAPPSDEVWEYTDMRRPAPDVTIQFEGMPPVDIAAGLVAIDPDTRAAAIHVAVHHPVFPQLPDELQKRVTFLLLDLVLGEELVETWIGGIDTAVRRPADAVPIGELLPAVAAFAADHVAEDGGPSWRLMEGETENGQRLVATAMVPLRSIQLPHLDTHVAVSVPYLAARDDGLPLDETLTDLRAFEDHLTERLGDSGRLLAHETAAGARTLHYYVDGSTPAAAQLEAAVRGWQDGPVSVEVAPDAGWEGVNHLS